tara:strand:- start:259 stop:645 length:387 start_codon:yes stop_codon:yes gene_type:complete
MAEKGDPVAKMSKADILKQFGPKILDQFGTDELRFIKNESKGPGGVDTLRRYVRDYFYNRGGMVKKKKLSQGGVTMKGKTKMAKKMMRGGAVPKRMRGGGMAKMAKKKMMRGGVAAKKMMRGGAVKKK